jgi:hypothetical protein
VLSVFTHVVDSIYAKAGADVTMAAASAMCFFIVGIFFVAPIAPRWSALSRGSILRRIGPDPSLIKPGPYDLSWTGYFLPIG